MAKHQAQEIAFRLGYIKSGGAFSSSNTDFGGQLGGLKSYDVDAHWHWNTVNPFGNQVDVGHLHNARFIQMILYFIDTILKIMSVVYCALDSFDRWMRWRHP